MTQETSIAEKEVGTKPASDLAPLTTSQQASKTGDDLNDLAGAGTTPTQNLVHIEPTKRRKTWGERLFDLTTYGGFALVGNEVTASMIVGRAEKPGIIGNAMRSGGELLKKIGKPGTLPYIQQRMNYISFAIIGGFVMVPFIKMLEDNKGRCVRFADRIFYGKRADEPEIAKKHEEMDEAPKQTWGSLGKGRMVTVAAAYTVDSTINWKDGLLARALKDTRFENYASAEHLSNHVSEWLNNKIAPIRKLSPEKSVTQKAFINNLVGLTTLSALLTILFYASSKVFAKKRDQKIEQRYAQLHDKKSHSDETDLSPEQLTQQAIEKAQASSKNATNDTPQPQVNSITRETTLTQTPQLAVQGV